MATCRFVQNYQTSPRGSVAELTDQVSPWYPPPLPSPGLVPVAIACSLMHLQAAHVPKAKLPAPAGRRRQLLLTAHVPAPGGAGALGPARNGLLLRVVAAQSLSGGREELSSPGTRSGTPDGRNPEFLEFPARQNDSTGQRREPPLVRVRCRSTMCWPLC